MRALRNLWTRTTDLLTGSAARATAVQRIYVSSADPAEAEEEVVAEPVSTTPASQHHSPKRGPSTAWKSSTQEDVKLEVEDLPDDAPHVVTFSEDARNGYSGHAQDRERWLEATKIQAMTRGPDATRKELRLPDSSPERPEGLNPLWMRVLIKMMKGTSSLMKFQGIFGDNASSRICNRRIQRLPRLALSRPEMQGAGYALQTITTCSTLLWQITGGRQGRLQAWRLHFLASHGDLVAKGFASPRRDVADLTQRGDAPSLTHWTSRFGADQSPKRRLDWAAHRNDRCARTARWLSHLARWCLLLWRSSCQRSRDAKRQANKGLPCRKPPSEGPCVGSLAFERGCSETIEMKHQALRNSS
ncbi:unnamed protein product [Durusdinium trenchii]|uniref:Uncharacterized protein n=1 Tax=Durusdinium trenchii TaxID=1381693 RepID=A0ABP0SAQ1_9DINO